MKKMVIIMMAVFGLFAGITLSAQCTKGCGTCAKEKKGCGAHKAGRMNRMKKMLNLSDDQIAQVKAIHEEVMKQMKSASSKEEKDDIRKVMQEEIKNILTAEQQEKFAEMRAKSEKKQARRGKCKKDRKGCNGNCKGKCKGKCEGNGNDSCEGDCDK